MWLHVFDDVIYVDAEVYIQSQPVNYEQILDVMTSISQPMYAYIDISSVSLTDVDIAGFIKIIWELHERTKDQKLLKGIYITGASPAVSCIWYTIRCLLPSFVRRLVVLV